MNDQNRDALPTEVLKAEHAVILRVMDVLHRLVERYEAGSGFEAASLGTCVELIRLFADACHHAKEEDLLFPALEARGIPRDGGPIGVMLEEHRIARQYTQRMGESLDAHERGDADAPAQFAEAAHGYVELLRNHIDKENNILYVMGNRVMTDDDQQSLCARFCEVACRSFGGKKKEQLERMADELEAQWSA